MARPFAHKGSSPLTRGAHSCRVLLVVLVGLIPAHAGSTPNPPTLPGARSAHPRSRGEHFLLIPILHGVTGSSPLTRGAQHGDGCTCGAGGLIPAHAGSTSPTLTRTSSALAHPRSRGEHLSSMVKCQYDQGSSPLTRGAQDNTHAGAHSQGLIPAHAGSTPKTPQNI